MSNFFKTELSRPVRGKETRLPEKKNIAFKKDKLLKTIKKTAPAIILAVVLTGCEDHGIIQVDAKRINNTPKKETTTIITPDNTPDELTFPVIKEPTQADINPTVTPSYISESTFSNTPILETAQTSSTTSKTPEVSNTASEVTSKTHTPTTEHSTISDPYISETTRVEGEAVEINNETTDSSNWVPLEFNLVEGKDNYLTPAPEFYQQLDQRDQVQDVEKKEIIVKPIYSGNPDRPEIALTFDDGFDYASISRSLEILRKKGVQTTFFVVGAQLDAYPDLWRQAVEDGHEICNHTYRHADLTALSSEEIRAEIARWEETAIKVLGEEYVAKMHSEFPYIRYPGGRGHNDERVNQVITELGLIPIAWTTDTYYAVLKHHDLSQEPVAPIAQKVQTHMIMESKNGSISLLHWNKWDIFYLEEIIKGIEEKGLKLVSVSQVIR